MDSKFWAPTLSKCTVVGQFKKQSLKKTSQKYNFNNVPLALHKISKKIKFHFIKRSRPSFFRILCQKTKSGTWRYRKRYAKNWDLYQNNALKTTNYTVYIYSLCIIKILSQYMYIYECKEIFLTTLIIACGYHENIHVYTRVPKVCHFLFCSLHISLKTNIFQRVV